MPAALACQQHDLGWPASQEGTPVVHQRGAVLEQVAAPVRRLYLVSEVPSEPLCPII